MILDDSFGRLKYTDVVSMDIFKDKLTVISIAVREGVITEKIIQEAIVLSVSLKANVRLYGDYGNKRYQINYDDMIKAVIPKVIFE